MLTLNTHNTPKYIHKSEDERHITHRHASFFSGALGTGVDAADFIIRIRFMWRVFRFRRSAQSVVAKIN